MASTSMIKRRFMSRGFRLNAAAPRDWPGLDFFVLYLGSVFELLLFFIIHLLRNNSTSARVFEVIVSQSSVLVPPKKPHHHGTPARLLVPYYSLLLPWFSGPLWYAGEFHAHPPGWLQILSHAKRADSNVMTLRFLTPRA